jgi:truncated hemoglobin YjbI
LRARTGMEFADSAEALSALDYTRRFTNMGHRWRGREVRANDVMPLMEQQIAKQSTGIAVAAQFGEDHSAAARQRFIQDYANDPQAAAALDMMTNRPGLNTLVADAVSRISNRGSESLNLLYRKAVQDYAARVAGKEPNPANWITDIMTFGRIGRGVENVGRAVTIWKSFILDIPEFVTQPTIYGTWKDLGRGLSMMLSRRPGMTRAESLREAVNLVKQEGLVEDFMGNHVFGESAEIGKRFAELISVPGSLSETGKQTLFAYNAKARLERWSRQESTQFDRDILRDVMQYSEADTNALVSGTADAVLKTQFQRDYVQLLSSRRGQGEGPAFADSPTANRLFRYVRWATNRMTNTVTAGKNVYDARQALQANRTPETQRAYYSSLKRAARMMVGTAVAGNVGSMLAYAFADMMRGENGFARWGREFMSAPVSTVLGNMGKQMIGGPIAQLATAAFKDEPERIISLVPPANAAYSMLSNVGDVASAWASGDVTKAIRKTRDFAYTVGEDVGVVPRSDVRSLMAWLDNIDQYNLTRRASEFERNENIKRPLGNRYRPEEYYDAVEAMVKAARDSDLSQDFLRQVADSRVRSAVQRGEEAPPEGMTNYEALKQALAIAPGESVASSIEGHRRMRHWTDEQRAKFIQVHGEETFRQMAQADEVLSELASAVRKYEGTTPTEWETSLNSVARQASLGASDRWTQLLDRTLNESAMRREAGEGFGEELEQLATEMAARPETLDRVFTDERMRKLLQRPMDTTDLQRIIYGQLRQRVVQRQKTQRREAAKERNR